MLVYNYNPITFELTGSQGAQPSPLEPGVFLVPAFATAEVPPNIPSGQKAVFNISTQAWTLQPISLSSAPSTPPIPTLQEAQSAQMAIIAEACLAAQANPLPFTTSGGVSANFPLDSASLAKYLGAYVKYYVKGTAFPSGASTYTFYSVTGSGVPMTVVDIENFFNAVEIQINSALAKQERLFTEIQAITLATNPNNYSTVIAAIVW